MSQTLNIAGSGHCCACSGVCYHVGGMSLCDLHRDLAARRALPTPVIPFPARPGRAAIGDRPCPAKVEAVLGFPEPTTIPCGLVEGHSGRHHYEIEWSQP